LLKELEVTSDTKLLDIITAQLIEVGKKIIVDRMKFVNELNQVINNVHSKISSDEKIEIVYQPSVTLEKIEEVFESKKMSDILSHQTNYGIQRDELVFLINDKNASKFASQGQIRNVILSTKLSLCKIIYKYKKKYPILLLDDVLSELDITRQNSLLNLLDNFTNVQTFISTVDTSSLNKEILKKYQIINL
jgi:DNA replication and repair protein RecF